MIEWIISNWTNLIQIWFALVTIASIVVKLTPTQKDNLAFEKIMNFVSTFIALNSKK